MRSSAGPTPALSFSAIYSAAKRSALRREMTASKRTAVILSHLENESRSLGHLVMKNASDAESGIMGQAVVSENSDHTSHDAPVTR